MPELPAGAAPAAPLDTAAVGPERPATAEPTAVASVPSTVFPHEAHHSVGCRTCHTPLPSHGGHAAVECTECHRPPAAFAALAVTAPEDCLACHHDPAQDVPCSTCHVAEAGGLVTVVESLELSAVTPPVERTLTLSHERHGDVACQACHTSGIRYEVERSCASCHERHHRPDADCLSCHPPARERHELAAHLGCSGAACHLREDVDALPESRAVCLACHAEQRSHEEGLACVPCHVTGREPGRGPGNGLSPRGAP